MGVIQDGWMKSTYRPKDADFSVTDICMANAQLWAKANTTFDGDKHSKTVGFKSFLGSALHHAIELQDEDGVLKEFSWVKTLDDGTRIGGTADELRWRYSIKKWRLGDVKLKGTYPTKKFLGIGTKAIPDPEPEQEKEQLQMSIYRWLFQDLFEIEDKGVIYLFTPGHAAWEKFPEYQEVWLNLLPITTMETYVKGKILISKQKEQPENDCPSWMCPYCSFTEACTYYEIPKEDKPHEFSDER